ncbi:hypothetical protein [Janthinobacterium fluminis]|uniref:Ferritin-like domain-containing protein n=1 Tax=Janthinobacterium fluminis TaxID=2987524 RepID=A0ABT5JYR8_9BURK|nr:hypothetical protein [Janthinobacterium fluminis]MDC8757303.1 hypothetical protein [Janthinobacterium fluminis]
MKTRDQSHIENIARAVPIQIGTILQGLPGCKSHYKGMYRETIEDIFTHLDVMKPEKFLSICAMYCNATQRESLFVSYMFTEYWGGKFIEDFLQRNPTTPNKALLLRHAEDEKRHSIMFAELANTQLEVHIHSEAFRKEERYHQAYDRWVGDDYFSLICLLHGFELRSALIQSYWFTLMDMFPCAQGAALRSIFSTISTDEVFHVTYTMQLVNEALNKGANPDTLARAVRLAEASLENVEAEVNALF